MHSLRHELQGLRDEDSLRAQALRKLDRVRGDVSRDFGFDERSLLKEIVERPYDEAFHSAFWDVGTDLEALRKDANDRAAYDAFLAHVETLDGILRRHLASPRKTPGMGAAKSGHVPGAPGPAPASGEPEAWPGAR